MDGKTNIVIPWIFEIFFSLFYTYLELKSIQCLTSFCRKKDSQFDKKKEIIFCMLYYGHILFID